LQNEKRKSLFFMRSRCRHYLHAAKENYETDDSREMISQFIHWAKEFEKLHQHIEGASIHL